MNQPRKPRSLASFSTDHLRSELLTRESHDPSKLPHANTVEAVNGILRPYFVGLTSEVFMALHINAANRVLAVQQVARGGIDQCPVDPRVLFARAIECGATGLILAHNHPSGSTEPSNLDISLTRSLSTSGRMLCIRVVDHLIFAGDSTVSLLARGFVPR